ncbi:MAG TPA: HAMP domain-containing sensor histidine kinase, partial [Bacteroidales bacterium]|nr:HAMP domain-containing sensor histidine kinase [Bacteroidales bacterium]
LMLATIFAVFISNKITYPLTILRDKMKLVKVGSKNEKIQWSAPDEIGELIENYNSMIDQLDLSVKKLAESEREGAWREMAKQIAHEIKNPLTPIKLNLQLLNKAWEQHDEQFEKRLKTISKSIIEQIDALAETANSFSNFAKLTEGNPETIVLNDLLTGCITLFENEQHITFISYIPDEVIEIYADRDKMLRLFNNIIKNAIQAIPLNTQGTITITVEHTHSKVLVSIADTGTGITPEVADKLFEPYFTTKSTGSGFGLAISKKIIEMSGGTIWFTTKVGEGTVFFIELPTCT